MEILNQYMNNWKGNNISYNLNTMYYYIYQSFLLKPPVKESDNIKVVSQPEGIDHHPPSRFGPIPAQGNDEEDDRELLVIQVRSKIDDFIDNMNRLIMRLSSAGVKMNKKHNKIIDMNENIITKKAVMESEIEYMENNIEKIEAFIDNNQEKDVGDVDDFICPEDEVSDLILDYLAEEKACDETLDAIKEQFRKKKITLNEYLDGARSISETQFMCMAKRRKIMSVISANKR